MVDERKWWAQQIKPRWNNLPARWAAIKAEDRHVAGIPDVFGCFDGVVAAIELKYVAKWPKEPDSLMRCQLSTAQQAHLRLWATARGNAYVLMGTFDYKWFLYDWEVFPLNATKEQVLDLPVLLSGQGWPSLIEVPKWIKATGRTKSAVALSPG